MLTNESRTGTDLLPGVGETKVEVKREAARPQPTGGFVSASPLLVDLDGDGALEVIAGSWDRRVYAWRADGRLLPDFPLDLGTFFWSATMFYQAAKASDSDATSAFDGRSSTHPVPLVAHRGRLSGVGAAFSGRYQGDLLG